MYNLFPIWTRLYHCLVDVLNLTVFLLIQYSSLLIFYLFSHTLFTLSLCFSRSIPLLLSLPDCLQHYANTFKGRLLLCRVILQRSCTPLMSAGPEIALKPIYLWDDTSPKVKPGSHTGHTHTHTHAYICMQEYANTPLHTHTKSTSVSVSW